MTINTYLGDNSQAMWAQPTINIPLNVTQFDNPQKASRRQVCIEDRWLRVSQGVLSIARVLSCKILINRFRQGMR